MPAVLPPVSLRLPKATRDKLDKAARATRRSRSFLMQEALERHLDEIVREDATARPKRFDVLLSLGGAGQRENAPRSAEDIQAYTNWLRGNAGE